MIYKFANDYGSGAEPLAGDRIPPGEESSRYYKREYEGQFETVGDLGAGCWLRRAPLLPPWKMFNAVALRGHGYDSLFSVHPLLGALRPLNNVLMQSDPAYVQVLEAAVTDHTKNPRAGVEYGCLHIRRYLSFTHQVAGRKPRFLLSLGLDEEQELTTLANDRQLYDVVSKVPFWRMQSSINCYFFNEEMVQKLVAADKNVKPLFRKVECFVN